jgi:hypothetical protein
VTVGRHREESASAGERYGKHSQAHADLPVSELFGQVIAQGDALRLAWPDEACDGMRDSCAEFPTGVLPVIRPRDAAPRNGVDHVKPATASDPADQSRALSGFSWWPGAVAG